MTEQPHHGPFWVRPAAGRPANSCPTVGLPVADGFVGSLAAALARAEIDVFPTDAPEVPPLEGLAAGPLAERVGGGHGAPPRCGVLWFDEFSAGLCDEVRRVSRDGADRVIAIATGSAAVAGGKVWALLQAGAADVVVWDASADPAAAVAARLARWAEVDAIVRSPLVQSNLVGRSPAWTAALRQVIEVARFTDASVLLTGETGTGKELVARLIHSLDARPDKRDLVVLDCTTVVPDLAGSEFFGHERGAFTSAVSAREGAFASADGGTLFLDEVGELPLPLQAALLRVVQERAYKPVGGNAWKRAKFRLVCATHRDLLREEARGAFRLDFYHRIAAWTCRLPSLDDRREDVLPLAEHFLRAARPGRPAAFDPAVRDYLRVRPYPGNVRELQQVVGRLAAAHVGDGPITAGDLPPGERPLAAADMRSDWRAHLQGAIRRALSGGVSLRDIGSGASEAAIETALADEDGNLQRAAKRLGVTDRALQLRRAAGRDRQAAGADAEGKTTS